ncbi:hypothetical protein [Brevibacillus fortis]|uniref:hypothetical protein n=1 Tax=Brevibacillus fortis TaxID=2126352 RepID=UPI00142D3563|nr:hypothetical protein [Brevibacillus fortis]
MDLPKKSRTNHTQQNEEVQAVANKGTPNSVGNEERQIESWGWSNNTEGVQEH